MFPTQEVNINDLKPDDNKTTLTGKSFLFDFNTGEFVLKNGNPVEVNGYEALKMWIKKILNTPKNKYDVYMKKDDYGITDLKELITSEYPYAFIKSEIEIVVKDVLLKNTAIKSIGNFKFERNKRLLIVYFECNTIYGVVESEVKI